MEAVTADRVWQTAAWHRVQAALGVPGTCGAITHGLSCSWTPPKARIKRGFHALLWPEVDWAEGLGEGRSKVRGEGCRPALSSENPVLLQAVIKSNLIFCGHRHHVTTPISLPSQIIRLIV